MAVLRTRVTGPVMLPDGSPAPNGGKVIFRLRSWDRQGSALIMKGPEEAVVVGGVIDKTLNRTSASERGTLYDVIYTYPNAAARGQWLDETLGSISLTGPGPVALADLLAIPAPVPNVPDVLAQALGAAASAQAAAASTQPVLEDRRAAEAARDEARAAAGAAAADANAQIAPAVSSANGAATRAEAAADAALGAAGWDQSVPDEAARLALTGLPDNWRVYQIAPAPGRIWRWTGTAWADTGENPLAGKPDWSTVLSQEAALWPSGQRELFDPESRITGKYVQADGTLGDNAAYFASDMMPVAAGDVVWFRRAASHVCFYSRTGARVGTVVPVAANASLTAPADGFVRFSATHTPAVSYTGQSVRIGGLTSTRRGARLLDTVTARGVGVSAARADAARGDGRSANIFDLAARTDGYIYDASGGLYQSGSTTNSFASGLMRVDPGGQYISNRAAGNATQSWECDQDGMALRNITIAANTPFTVSTDCYYLKFSVTGLANAAQMMVVAGSALPATYVRFRSLADGEAALSLASDLTSRRADGRPNLVDPSGIQLGFYPSPTNGAISGAGSSTYFMTGIMPVIPGQQIFVTCHDTVDVNIKGAWYGMAGNWISDQASGAGVLTVPANAFGYRVYADMHRRASSLHVSVDNTAPAGFRPFIATGPKPFTDAQAMLLGDSFSDPTGHYRWINDFIAETQMRIVANYALSGRPTRNALKDRAGVDLAAPAFDTVDTVIVELGTNDYGGSRALGTIGDASDSYAGAGSFFNDVYRVLKGLFTFKPSLRVVWLTPAMRGDTSALSQPSHPAANAVGAYLPQYIDAIKEVCGLFGTPAADMLRQSGWNLLNLAVMTGDNLHPNYEGGRVWGKAAGFLTNALGG